MPAITQYERKRMLSRTWRAVHRPEALQLTKTLLIKLITQNKALHITESTFISLGGRKYMAQAGKFVKLWRRNHGEEMERILADFEQTRDAPQRCDRCFVFDEREALDPALESLAT